MDWLGVVLAVQAIHNASYKDHRHIVEWLVLEMGVKLDVRNEAGTTPLHDACFQGSLATVQWIVEHDSHLVALRTNKHKGWKPGLGGATPLRWAELYGQEAVVRYLKASPYYARAAQEAAEAAKAKARERAEAEKAAEAMAAQLILEEEEEDKAAAAKKKKGEAQGKANSKAKKKGGKKKK